MVEKVKKDLLQSFPRLDRVVVPGLPRRVPRAEVENVPGVHDDVQAPAVAHGDPGLLPQRVLLLNLQQGLEDLLEHPAALVDLEREQGRQVGVENVRVVVQAHCRQNGDDCQDGALGHGGAREHHGRDFFSRESNYQYHNVTKKLSKTVRVSIMSSSSLSRGLHQL